MTPLRLVLAVDAINGRDARLRYPPCFNPTTRVPLPPRDPPAWVLPGGQLVQKREALAAARRLGATCEDPPDA
jgi:hypothetical protein